MRIRSDNDEANTPEPLTGLQGEGGACRHPGDRTVAQLAEQHGVHPSQITAWKEQLQASAANVFGPGGGSAPAAPAVDVKQLHAKIGELTLENDFLEGALTKAGLLSARR